MSGSTTPTPAVTSVAKQNVVDGLELHRRWTAAGRTWPGAVVQGVQDEFLALDEALDAVGDVLLNEAVFHAVRGNSTRARAALDIAARPGGAPPELEAIYTPYSGTGVVHRLLALFPGIWAPAPGWSPDPQLAHRSRAEPRLDAWAGRLLGDPKRVHYRVEYRDPGTGEVVEAVERRLDQLRPALSPLDVVYAAVASERSQLSEIEQRVVYQALRERPAGVPADARAVVVGSRQPELEHKVGLLEVMELAQALRETIADARAIEPSDLAVPGKAGGIATEHRRARRAGDGGRSGPAGGSSRPLHCDRRGRSPGAAHISVGGQRLGIAGTVPLSASGDSPTERADLGVQASTALSEARRRIGELPDTPPVDGPDALARLGSVFGPAFRALPRLRLPVPGAPNVARSFVDPAFTNSRALQGGDPFAATVWFQRLSRVREGARRLADALLLADMLGGRDPLRLEVDQLPGVANDRWIALPYGDGAVPTGRVSVVGYLPRIHRSALADRRRGPKRGCRV